MTFKLCQQEGNKKRDCTLDGGEIPAFKGCWEMSIIQLVLVRGGSCVFAEAGVFMFEQEVVRPQYSQFYQIVPASLRAAAASN